MYIGVWINSIYVTEADASLSQVGIISYRKVNSNEVCYGG